MKEFKISVIIPVYNMEALLPRAMQSLLEQTIGFENLEVIFVDDCSTDGTKELLQRYSTQYENVFLYSTEANTGAAGEPRNIGLSNATAPYIMFLDPDDWYLPDACNYLYQKIANSYADIIGGTYRVVTDDNVTPCGETPEETKHLFELPYDLKQALVFRLSFWTKIYRREMIEKGNIRFPPYGSGEDTAFLCECFTNANKYIFYSVPVYNYYIRSDSATNRGGKPFFSNNVAAFRKCYDVLKDYPEEAAWIQGNLSTFFVQKCVAFNEIGHQELVEILREYRELFDVASDDTQQKVVCTLVKEDRLDVAAEYILAQRAEREQEEKKKKDLLWNVNRVSELEAEQEKKEKDLLWNKNRVNELEEELDKKESQSQAYRVTALKWQKDYDVLQQEMLKRCCALEASNSELTNELSQTKNELQLIYDSDMYKFSLKYYKFRDTLLPENSWITRLIKKLFNCTKRTDTEVKCEKDQDQDEVNNQDEIKNEVEKKNQIEMFFDYGKFTRMGIVTTKHTVFIARLLQRQLHQLGIHSQILVGEPENYEDIPYVIICPLFIKKFPKVYVAFQMEQTVSSRWFTEEYLVKLQNSCAIFDYSLQNMKFYYKPENADIRTRAYYLPVDYYSGYRESTPGVEKEYDVLFYGDIKNCERRKNALEELSKHYKVKLCSEVFGEELYREIEKAKVVVNIHFYEGALLETTRLYEVLSLNTSAIVSERSTDTAEDERLEDIVDFVDIGDVDQMVARVGYWVNHDAQREQKVRQNKQLLEDRPNAFSFFFKRFLLAYDRITFEEFYRTEKDFVTLDTNRICLSLPESTERRKSFDKDNRYGFQCFPGLRHQKGWVGCGLSYKFIFRKALEAGMQEVMICEDDVIFPEQFTEKLDSIQAELAKQERWSIFSGVMADVGRVEVSMCTPDENGYMMQINHMVSMVFNIYNREMFELFRDWDEQNRDVEKNTIDRYLESKELAVFVRLPFLVGHKEELDSTIWGFSNTTYSTMIENCQKKLLEEARTYTEKKSL